MSQHNIAETVSDSIYRRFIPQRLEILVIVFIDTVLVLMAILNALQESSVEVAAARTYLENTVASLFIDTVNYLADTLITASVATMMLWALVGMAAYIVYTLLTSSVVDAFATLRDILFFSHPNNYNSGSVLLAYIYQKIIFTTGLFMLILLGSTVLESILPFCYEHIGVLVLEASSRSFVAALYLGLLSFALHGWYVLGRLLKLTLWQFD